MVAHRDDNQLLGIRFESHHQMFSSLFGDGRDFRGGKYVGDIRDLLGDLELVAERLRSSASEDSIPDTSEEYKALKFTYTNYRGETSVRNAIVLSVRWGNTEWHPEHGMLLKAFDLDKQEMREFALKDCDFTRTEESKLVIRPGGRYRTRAGTVICITGKFLEAQEPYQQGFRFVGGPCGQYYTEDGKTYVDDSDPNPGDLIEEVV